MWETWAREGGTRERGGDLGKWGGGGLQQEVGDLGKRGDMGNRVVADVEKGGALGKRGDVDKGGALGERGDLDKRGSREISY
jgi:hypothetical protein